MGILIHQAVYGEKDNGHKLLRHSFELRETPQAIVLKTDLPSGHANHPRRDYYLSSFTSEEYYILLKSIPDPDANRGAFVHTFALFIKKENLLDLHDLSQIIKVFPNSYSEDWIPEVLNIELQEQEENTQLQADKLLTQLADNLLNNDKVTVWLGMDGFEELICLFWNRIPENLRRLVKFRVSFGPRDLNTQEQLILVYSPESLKHKWEGFPLIKQNDTPTIANTSEIEYLINSSKGQSVETIIDSLGINIQNFNTVKTISRLNEYVKSSDINDLLDAIDLLKTLSPNTSKGVTIKKDLIKSVNDSLRNATINEIVLLRNVSIDHLAEKKPFDIEIKKILHSQLTDSSIFTITEKLLKSCGEQKMDGWLSSLIQTTLIDLCKNWNRKLGNLFWNILLTSNNPAAILSLFNLAQEETEQILERTLPESLDSKSSSFAISIAQEHKWYRLHAHLLTKESSRDEILEKQLVLDPSISNNEAFKILSNYVETLTFIEFTIAHPHESLISISSELLTKDSDIIKHIKIEVPTWVDIWTKRTTSGAPVFSGVSEPIELTFGLLDLAVSGITTHSILLNEIGKTEYANIAKYSKRKLAWNYLEGQTKQFFINQSLVSSVRSFLEDTNSNSLEVELSSNVGNNESINSLILNQQFSNRNILTLFEICDNLKEPILIRHLNKSNRSYSDEAAEQLGYLLKNKDWLEAYKKVKKEYSSNNESFKQTIKIAKDTFPLFESTLFDSIGKLFSNKNIKQEHTENAMASNKKKVLILTAIEVEYKTVKSFLNDYKPEKHPATGTMYGRATYGDSWDVLLVETEAGNNNAAIEAERAITHFNPEYVLFVGIAGGLKDVKIGDVVVGSKVYGIESAKAGEELLSRHEFGQPTNRIKEIAKAIRKDDTWLENTSRQVSSMIGKTFELNAFLKPIAAGEKVVSSTKSKTYNYIKKSAGDSLAVEMEGIGFLKACYVHENIQYILIRGISDLVDNKSETDGEGGQELASFTASAFAFEILNRIEL